MMEVIPTPASDDEEAESVQLSQQSVSSQTIRSLFAKKTKKIVDGKWMECLDPKPVWTESEKANNDLVVWTAWTPLSV